MLVKHHLTLRYKLPTLRTLNKWGSVHPTDHVSKLMNQEKATTSPLILLPELAFRNQREVKKSAPIHL